jgi:hypothetical protein
VVADDTGARRWRRVSSGGLHRARPLRLL